MISGAVSCARFPLFSLSVLACSTERVQRPATAGHSPPTSSLLLRSRLSPYRLVGHQRRPPYYRADTRQHGRARVAVATNDGIFSRYYVGRDAVAAGCGVRGGSGMVHTVLQHSTAEGRVRVRQQQGHNPQADAGGKRQFVFAGKRRRTKRKKKKKKKNHTLKTGPVTRAENSPARKKKEKKKRQRTRGVGRGWWLAPLGAKSPGVIRYPPTNRF